MFTRNGWKFLFYIEVDRWVFLYSVHAPYLVEKEFYNLYEIVLVHVYYLKLFTSNDNLLSNSEKYHNFTNAQCWHWRNPWTTALFYLNTDGQTPTVHIELVCGYCFYGVLLPTPSQPDRHLILRPLLGMLGWNQMHHSCHQILSSSIYI